MNPTAENFDVDRQKVQEILARFSLPSEIEKVDTEFDLDSGGDPAVRLTFHVRDEAHIGQEELERLTKFLSEVTSALLQGNIAGFPYTRLEQKV
jgi:hypothetical protein